MRAATIACCAALAWIANWSVHAAMALERPLGVPGPICGSPSVPAPDAPCPVCENALAAGAGSLSIPHAFACLAAPANEGTPIRVRAAFAYDVLADAPARAPPGA